LALNELKSILKSSGDSQKQAAFKESE
jgi:hypothetical protein